MNAKYFLVLILAIFSGVCAQKIDRPDYSELVTEDELEAYIHNKTKPSYLGWVFHQFGKSKFLQSRTDSNIICSICPLLVNLLVEERRQYMTSIQLTAEVSYFCSLLGIEHERVCEGIIELNADIFGYIIDNDHKINGEKICGMILEQMNCGKPGNWTVDVPQGQTVDKIKPDGKESLKILHITDIHYDPLYTEGKSTDCGEPVCCQSDQIDSTNDSNYCGYWASYKQADVPLHTIEALFNHTATQDYDFVYFTGDIVSHRVWSTSPEKNTEVISKIYDLFHQYFKKPVYFVLGNHEGHPVNTFSSEDVKDTSLSTQWLYKLMLEKSAALKKEDVEKTILKGGYYTVSPKEGFRLIVLNDNVCSVENWWLLHDEVDPYGQLQWMASVLEEAEKNKEIVHILGHIPTSSCLKTWSHQFGRIVGRFAHTIAAQFYGHAHKDELYVYYNQSDSSQAINVGWNGGSVIADTSNPNYRLYDVDAKTFAVLDYAEFTFNLTLANLNRDYDLEWYKLYSFKDAYGVDSLEPTEIDELLQKMAKNHSYLDLYHNYKYRNSDVAVASGCDDGCKKNLLCSMAVTEFAETERCESLLKLYDESM